MHAKKHDRILYFSQKLYVDRRDSGYKEAYIIPLTPTCDMGIAVKHSVPHQVKQLFVIFDWASECSDVKNYKWRLNPVWHRMLYNCTHMASVGVKGLLQYTADFNLWTSGTTYHDQYFSLRLFIVTCSNNLQDAANNLFRSVHVVHCADTNNYHLQVQWQCYKFMACVH